MRPQGAAARADRVSAEGGHRIRRQARGERGGRPVHGPDAEHRRVGSCRSAPGRGVRAHRSAAGARRFSEVRHARRLGRDCRSRKNSKRRDAQPATDEAKADAPDAADATPPANAGAEAGSSDQASQVGLKMTEQGWLISVREPLTDKERETGPMPPVRAAPPAAPERAGGGEARDAGHGEFRAGADPFLYGRWCQPKPRTARPIRGPAARSTRRAADAARARLLWMYTETTISLTWPRQPEDAALPAAAAAPAAAPRRRSAGRRAACVRLAGSFESCVE